MESREAIELKAAAGDGDATLHSRLWIHAGVRRPLVLAPSNGGRVAGRRRDEVMGGHVWQLPSCVVEQQADDNGIVQILSFLDLEPASFFCSNSMVGGVFEVKLELTLNVAVPNSLFPYSSQSHLVVGSLYRHVKTHEHILQAPCSTFQTNPNAKMLGCYI